jgi:tetratricopeptide (TPR) repeat protein
MPQSPSPEQKQSALLRILKATTSLPAQITLYASALGAIALTAGADLPPVLAAVAGGVGVNALSNILERVARGEDLSDEEICSQLQAAIDDSTIGRLLTEEEFQRAVARLHHWQASIAYAIDQHEAAVAQRLAEQTRQYAALTAEVRAGFATVLEELAALERLEEIVVLLRGLLELLSPGFDQRGQEVGVRYDVVTGRAGQPSGIPLQRLLPVPHFTGREDELARLLIDLRPGRVVTLCGPGGIGKTALASEAVWLLAPGDAPPERFPDGVIFHSFYNKPEALLALETIARAYGKEPQPTPDAAALRALSGRRALLVLDGTENADDLSAVLEIAGSCGVLITTRRRADAPIRRQDVERLPGNQAIELFQAWGGGRTADQEVARRICELVGGLPLAVRLASRYLSQCEEDAADYLAWLEETPLVALDHGNRQRESVPLLLERSLEHVSESACDVLSVVGLLALAPFAREPIAAALDITSPIAGRALGELVNYSLLLRGSDRYEVSHALVHTYARLEMSPTPSVAKRLIAYYTALASEQSALGLPGYIALDAERAHLIAVVDRCVALQEWQATRNLVWAVDDYLNLRGYWLERKEVLRLGLVAARAQERRDEESSFLGHLGASFAALGQLERAIGLYEEALAIARALQLRDAEKVWLGNLGHAYRDLGQAERAIGYYQEALAITRVIGDRRGEGAALGSLGNTYRDLGQVKQAIASFEDALAIAQEVGDQRNESILLVSLGAANSSTGQLEKARDFYEEALVIAREIGDVAVEGTCLGNLGNAHRDLGQLEQAIDYYKQALTIAREIGDRHREGNWLGSLGLTYAFLGDNEQAIEYYQEALAVSREVGDVRNEGFQLGNLGNAYRELGLVEQARTLLKQSLVIFEEIKSPNADRVREWLAQLPE